MKADSELKATLEEKNIQLERQNVSTYGSKAKMDFSKISIDVLSSVELKVETHLFWWIQTDNVT